MGSSLSFQMLQEEGGSILHSSHSHYIVSPIEYPKVRHKSNKWRWFCRKKCLILQIPPKLFRLGFQYSLSLNYALSCHECRFEAVGLNTYIFGRQFIPHSSFHLKKHTRGTVVNDALYVGSHQYDPRKAHSNDYTIRTGFRMDPRNLSKPIR